MSPATLARVLALDRALRRETPLGVRSIVPAYSSVLCTFDPDVTDAARLTRTIQGLELPDRPRGLRGRLIEVPTRYGGPDLEAVCEHTGLSPELVVSLHAGVEYLVYSLGFAPGFTYCGELPRELETPRLAIPRTRVPPGSVGIAGRQTGIYAVESPGGWNLIGCTDLLLFDPGRRPAALFRPGDRVRFTPVP